VTDKIHKWHILISGFTQTTGKANGFDKLWLKLRPHASTLVTLTQPQEWNSNFKNLASFVERMKPEEEKPDIRVYAYSWGCGHGFIRLAKELKKRGHKINYAVLCDPVFHSYWRPWRSMLTGKWSPPIKIPDNVGTVFSFKQRQNRPQATELIACSDNTTLHSMVELKANHAWMDDQPEFHKCCLNVAGL